MNSITKVKADGFAIAFPDDVASFRVQQGRLAAFIAGIEYFDEEVFDSSDDVHALSNLVSQAVDAGVITGDPRLTFYIDAEQGGDDPNWHIGIRRASSWTPQLSTGMGRQLNGISDAGSVADQIRAAVTEAVNEANKALAELLKTAVIA